MEMDIAIYMEMVIHIYIHTPDTGCRTCRGRLIFIGHFPQKSPIMNISFADRDQQFKVS